MQHLETETSWESTVKHITLWFSRSQMQSHTLNTIAQTTEPTLFVSTYMAKLPMQYLLLLSTVSFFPIPHPRRRILNATDAHSLTFQSISVFHRHIPLSHLAFYFLREAGAISKTQCRLGASGPLSHLTPSPFLFTSLSHVLTKAKTQCVHLKEAFSVIASAHLTK